MNDHQERPLSAGRLLSARWPLSAAFKYSFPVFLGYIAIGIAFGLFTLERGYPWYLASITGIIMYAGAGQFIAVGLFAAGASLAEAVLIELVVNARHIAYGISMLRRFRSAGPFRFYLIFALTDETFALLSSLPELPAQETPPVNLPEDSPETPLIHLPETPPINSPEDLPETSSAARKAELERRVRFMFLVSLLNQVYWNLGILTGVLAGSLIPWDFEGVRFALSALFIVLMIEQFLRVKRPLPFVVSAIAAVAAVFFLPPALSLLSAMLVSLGLVQLFEIKRSGGNRTAPGGGESC